MFLKINQTVLIPDRVQRENLHISSKWYRCRFRQLELQYKPDKRSKAMECRRVRAKDGFATVRFDRMVVIPQQCNY